MRAESTYIIGTMVGSAIETVAGMCPGGEVAAEARRGGPDDNDEGRAASAQALYARYLDSIGHPEEAAWLRAEWAARLKARAAFEGGVDLVWFGPAMPVTRLAAMWAAGMLLLLNAGWLALMGLAAWRASKGKAEAPGTRGGLIVWGLAALGCLLGALLAGGIAASAMLSSDYLVSQNGITYAGWPGFIPAAFLCAMWVRGVCLARRWAWLTAFTGALAITLGAMLATTCALAGHGGVYDMLRMAATLVVPIPANDRVSADTYIQAALSGAALVPALLLLAATVVSLFCRVPMSKGWARAMRGLAIPSVCVILLAYAGLLVQTARTEALCSHAIERITENEGRFLAELSGKEWPGRTP